MDFSYLERNIAEIRERMDAARKESGREDEISLIVAAKSGSAEELNYLHEHCGVNDIGENRVQQLLEHYEQNRHRHYKKRDEIAVNEAGFLAVGKNTFFLVSVIIKCKHHRYRKLCNLRGLYGYGAYRNPALCSVSRKAD